MFNLWSKLCHKVSMKRTKNFELQNSGLKNNLSWLPCRYERIEIPIHIVPHVTIGKVCLESAVELPKILCQEEQDAYRRIHRYPASLIPAALLGLVHSFFVSFVFSPLPFHLCKKALEQASHIPWWQSLFNIWFSPAIVLFEIWK